MNLSRYHDIVKEIEPTGARLVAVSKTKPVSDISELYGLGQRLFGENKTQEMCAKYEDLPKDIEWHLVGHLQTNKVKYIAPFVSMIHSVDSIYLLEEIDRQAARHQRIIPCLLQLHIAMEDTKYGLDEKEACEILESGSYKQMKNIELCGLMGIATYTDDEARINREFGGLKAFFDKIKAEHFADKGGFKELSMGMSADYRIALRHGATLIRIGSEIFGTRGS